MSSSIPTSPARGRRTAPRRAAALAIASALAVSATGCSVFGGGDEAEDDVVRIGVVAQDDTNTEFAELAQEELGIEVEMVNFDDYNQPNPALSNGDLDMNWFQHIAYLANYNVANDDDLAMIGGTEVVPLALYSEEYGDLGDFEDGDTVAIANDEINQARGINVLAEAGLLELSNDVAEPRPSDIDEEASTVSVEPVAAQQTVNALQSVEGSVINNSFTADAEIDPNTALFSDDPEADVAFPYINGFVVRAEDRDDERLQQLAELYHDQRILDSAAEVSEGTSVPRDPSAEELQDGLDEYEDSLRQNQTEDPEDGEDDEA